MIPSENDFMTEDGSFMAQKGAEWAIETFCGKTLDESVDIIRNGDCIFNFLERFGYMGKTAFLFYFKAIEIYIKSQDKLILSELKELILIKTYREFEDGKVDFDEWEVMKPTWKYCIENLHNRNQDYGGEEYIEEFKKEWNALENND